MIGCYWASKPRNKNLIKVEHPIRVLVWSQKTGVNPHAFDEMFADRSKWNAYRGGPTVESRCPVCGSPIVFDNFIDRNVCSGWPPCSGSV